MSGTASLPGRPLYLGFLPDFLFVPDDNKARYVLRAWLLMLIPSILLSAAVGFLLPQSERPEIVVDGPVMVVLLVLVGPLIETLLMIPPVLLVNRFAGAGPAVIASAILWGVLHSLQTPAWGLVTWWPFLILSIAFLTWRERGTGLAILLVTLIHGLQNSVAAALALYVTATSGAAPT